MTKDPIYSRCIQIGTSDGLRPELNGNSLCELFDKCKMTMWLSIILSLASLSTLHSKTITVTNNCKYKVWFHAFHLVIKLIPEKIVLDTEDTVTNNMPDGLTIGVSFYAITGCDDSGENSESGQKWSDIDMILTRFWLNLNYYESWILLRLDRYSVTLSNGYNIPVSVAPIDIRHTTNHKCNRLLCNATLDDCPDNENNDKGDLTVMKDGHAVACRSPCKKWETLSLCDSQNEATYKYFELLDRVCREDIMEHENHDNIIMGRCRRGSNYHIITCP